MLIKRIIWYDENVYYIYGYVIVDWFFFLELVV